MQQRPLLLLAITVFFELLGFGIVLPNMPRYIETAVGINHSEAAFIGGILRGLLLIHAVFVRAVLGALFGSGGSPPGHPFVARRGRRGVPAIRPGGGPFVDAVAARLLAGVLSSASIGVAFAYVADVTTPENRARGMGLLGACFGLGFMLGPAFGGLLGHKILSLPAFVAAGMALTNLVFAWRYLPESLSEESRGRAEALGRGFAPRLLPAVLGGPGGFLFALTFLVTFAFSALEQTFGFYLLSVPSFNVTEETQPLVYGGILAFAGLIGIIIQGGLIGRLVARFGEGNVAVAGVACLVLGFVVFSLPGTVWALAAGPMLLLSIGRALTAPALSALVSRKANLGQGLTLSTSQSFDALARTFGPLTGGGLFLYAGPTVPYALSAAVMAAALLLALAKREEMLVSVPVSNKGF